MKRIFPLLTAVLFIGVMASTAAAIQIGHDTQLDGDSTPTTTWSDAQVWDFEGDNPINDRPNIFQTIETNQGAVVTGSKSGKYAAPYLDDTQYLSVPDEDYGSSGSFKVSLSETARYFGMLWGSMDSYNTLTFWNQGTEVGSFTGDDVTKPANGNQTNPAQNRYVNFYDFEFDQFELASTNFAFEVDNIAVAPVPEPGTFVLMGLGLAGLVGMRKKFRK
jgi:hypothetical protein